MKKLLALFLAVILLLALAGCSSRQYIQFPNMTAVLDTKEYVLYQNIFFNGAADDYVEKTATKEGTLVRLYDAFIENYRYYVWGYNDATKCCDWQWEFVPSDPDSLPGNGSLVKITGTLRRDDAALDQYWFTNTSLEVIEERKDSIYNVDMTVMNATLERVQLVNMQKKPGSFTGKTLRIYGRVQNSTTIQHPYYDNVWTLEFKTDAEVPAIGTMVILTGSWQGNIIQVGKVESTGDY